MQDRQEETKNTKTKGNVAKFAGSFMAACAAAAAFFFLWAWAAYSMRLSLELIRAGLIVWYILPCMIGGKVLKVSGCRPLFVAALLLGGSFFAVLYGCSYIQKGGAPALSQNSLTVLFLCVAAALLGAAGRKKQ